MVEIWFKAAHIAALSMWAAGLVAMPGALHDLDAPASGEKARQLRFARLAFELIISPAAVITVATGTVLIFVASYKVDWLAPKLLTVGGMALLHMLIARALAIRKKRLKLRKTTCRLMTLGAVICISVVLALVLAKPAIEADLFPTWLTDGRPEGFLSWLEAHSNIASGLASHPALSCAFLLVLVRNREPVLEHKLSSVPPCKPDEQQLKPGGQQPPWKDSLLRRTDPLFPIQPENRDEDHGDDGMAPGGRMPPGAGYECHLACTRECRHAAHHEGGARSPKGSAGKERIARPPVGDIAACNPESAGDWESHKHCMNRVAEDRDTAVEVVEATRRAASGADYVRSPHLSSFFSQAASAAVRLTGTVAAPVMVAACTGPLSTLDPAGPIADRIANLWWVMLAGATLILAGVCVLAIVPFLQSPRMRGVSSNLYLWGGGLAFPIVTLAALMLYAFAIEPLERQALNGQSPLRIMAIARQWEWEFVYPDAPGGSLRTGDRLHIPAGRPIAIEIASEDVIHSFWVPRLAGKMDAIPGRINDLTILARAPGVYGAVCGEFCGLGHALMTFTVEAHAPEDFGAVLARINAETARGGSREVLERSIDE